MGQLPQIRGWKAGDIARISYDFNIEKTGHIDTHTDDQIDHHSPHILVAPGCGANNLIHNSPGGFGIDSGSLYEMDEVLQEPKYKSRIREVEYKGPHEEVGVVSVSGPNGLRARGDEISVFVSHPLSVQNHVDALVQYDPLIQYMKIDPRDREMQDFRVGLMNAWKWQLEYVRNVLAQRDHLLLPVFTVNYVGIIPIVKQIS
jgi:hypothetical protein